MGVNIRLQAGPAYTSRLLVWLKKYGTGSRFFPKGARFGSMHAVENDQERSSRDVYYTTGPSKEIEVISRPASSGVESPCTFLCA